MNGTLLGVFSDDALPLIFMGLMGVSMLVYAILDGYDLGVGILISGRSRADRDTMIASIGPFWDANETWLVLGVGVLLVAFPKAHGVILGTLYIPVVLMLAGLILRGVSFDFRAKAKTSHQALWDRLFFFGSLLTALTQGYMLGQYIVGFANSLPAIAFSLVSAMCVTSAYALIGACWLILKSTGELQIFAIARARKLVVVMSVGLLLVSIVNPLASASIFNKWFAWPETLFLAPLPILSVVLLVVLIRVLRTLPLEQDRLCWLPFVLTIGIFVLAFAGLAYSFFPYIVPQSLTVWQAASSPESLRVVLLGCVVVLPAIAFYTILSYWIFRGKSTALTYY